MLHDRVIRPDVLAMTPYHVPDARGLLKLDAMENPYTLPLALREELARRLSALELNRYPGPAHAELRQAVARAFGIPAEAEVLLGNGSDELIAIMTLATAREDATVLAPTPSFVMYQISALLAGSRFVGVPLRADFSLDLPATLAAIEAHDPALVYLAYPNNPTGNCFEDDAIERIIAASRGLVVIDEAYQPFAQQTWMGRLAEFPNLVVMRTVSKLGLAGIRIGYMAAEPSLIEQFDKVRPPYNISVLNEAAALFAIEHLELFNGQAEHIRAGRAALVQALESMPGVQPFPSRANFVLIRVADAPRSMQALRARGVLVKDVSRMHRLLSGCLRVTVGTPEENRIFLEALAASV
ncbi:MAG: histidinol-phosphate transaminase [Burkholderiales bacterium]|nr:MAG: histidinol-phosphate transaminase [Burkholderiales bacterium]